MLISGGTGAGKTTLLNVLSSFISERERIVTIEDAAELQLHQEHVARLETRPPNVEGKGAIRQRQLLVNALRMRPDRIVVGEVRGEEALDMLQAMNTGHDGSLTTVHANTPRDALSRIETMIAMGATNLPERAMRQQIAAAIQIVIQQSRMSDGTRKVTSISEITGMEGDVITMQEIFLFEKLGVTQEGKVIGRFRATGVRPEVPASGSRPRASPAARHVRRRHGGAVMVLLLLVTSRSSSAPARARRLLRLDQAARASWLQRKLDARLEEVCRGGADGATADPETAISWQAEARSRCRRDRSLGAGTTRGGAGDVDRAVRREDRASAPCCWSRAGRALRVHRGCGAAAALGWAHRRRASASRCRSCS